MSLADTIYAQAPTPYRESQIQFRIPEYLITRDGWGLLRAGADVANGPDAAAGSSAQVVLLPNGHWQAESDQMRQRFDIAGSSAISMWLPGGAGLLTPANFQTFESFGQIPGVTYDPGVTSPGNTFVRKQVSASAASWSANLASDQTAFPEPDYGTSDVTIDRVALTDIETGGKLGGNCPTYLRFIGPPAALQGFGAILTWYFGGPVALTGYPTGSVGPPGGEFALSLYGSGEARLFERTLPKPSDHTLPDPSHPWRFLKTFSWCPTGEIHGKHHMLMAVPEGPGQLSILTGLGRNEAGVDYSRGFCFNVSRSVCAYETKDRMTGPGPVRLSMRQDLRCPFQLGYFTYDAIAAHNTLAGHPFTVPFAVPADTNIQLVVQGDLPTGTSVDASLWEPITQTELAAGAASGDALTTNWTAPAGDLSIFYPRVSFGTGGTTDTGAVGSFSPSVYGYATLIETIQDLSDDEPFSGDTFLGGGTMEWSAAGADTEPSSASCHILIDDVHDFLTTDPAVNPNGGLDVHSGLRFQIATPYLPDDPTAKLILFDGILQVARATFHPMQNYPRRRLYNCQGAGMWARLAEPNQVNWVQRYLIGDSSGTGPRITDIVRGFLSSAGFPAEQIGIADNPIRYVYNPKNPHDWQRILPGVRLVDLIDYFTKSYLRASLHWEPNAGVNQRGMWHLLYPPFYRPDGLYDYRWHFTALPPDAEPGVIKAVHVPASYPDKHSFVTSLETWVEAPEANWLQIVAADMTPGGDPAKASVPKGIVSRVIWNPRSYQESGGYPAPDKSHPDYIGRKKRARYADALLNTDQGGAQTEANCELIARILLDQVGYGRLWKTFEGPLFPVYDVADPYLYGRPRLPRTYDLCTLTQEDGLARPCVVSCAHPRSANPVGDIMQEVEIEAHEIVVPVGY